MRSRVYKKKIKVGPVVRSVETWIKVWRPVHPVIKVFRSGCVRTLN